MLFVSVAEGHVATFFILGQGHSEVGYPALFFAVVWFKVNDRYPLRLVETKN